MIRRCVVLFAICGACRGGDEPPRAQPEPPRPRAVRADAAVATSFVGVITAADVVDVAPRFDGVVAAVLVRAGDKVKANQVLVEMDPRPMREQLRAAEAAVAAAQAARRQAEVDVEDARRRVGVETKAVANGVSSQVTLDEAQFALKRAEAAAERATSTVAAETSRMQTARDHLTDMSLRAKSDGVIAMRFKDPGATVTSGSPIVRVISRSEPRLRFALPPEYARSLAVGATVAATIETIATPLQATVRQVSPTLDAASGMIIVEAELAAGTTSAELRPGLPVAVRF